MREDGFAIVPTMVAMLMSDDDGDGGRCDGDCDDARMAKATTMTMVLATVMPWQ